MAVSPRHEPVLRALAPVSLCRTPDLGLACACPWCALTRVDATFLDEAQDYLEEIHRESRLSTAVDLAAYEAVYNLSAAGLTEAERRARLLAAKRAQGGLSKAYFLKLAADLGYAIEIVDSQPAFRAGVDQAGSPVYSVNRLTLPASQSDLRHDPAYPADFFVWPVIVLDLGVHENTDLLVERFEALKPAYSVILWYIPMANVLPFPVFREVSKDMLVGLVPEGLVPADHALGIEAIGYALESRLPGQSCRVSPIGELGPLTVPWPRGTALYLGLNGQATASPPTTGICQRIGTATTSGVLVEIFPTIHTAQAT